jgi:hypothetical protein
VSKAPFTYLNRLRLKKRFRKTVTARISRERLYSGESTVKKGISYITVAYNRFFAKHGEKK